MKKFKFAIQLTSFSLLVSIFSGCASVSNTTNQMTAADYLQLAQRAQGQQRARYQLNAVNNYLTLRHVASAQQILDQISSDDLTKALAVQKQLQAIRITLIKNHSDEALKALNDLKKADIKNNKNLTLFYKLYAQAFQQKGDTISAINIRSRLTPILATTKEKKNNLWSIWQALQTIDLEKLQADAEQTPDKNLSGWLSLAALTKTWESQPNELLSKLQAWQTANPNHPATELLPKKLQQTGFFKQPEKIALLVPLSGKLAAYGKAIKNGFFTAYYDQKSRLNLAPIIHVYDTNKNTISIIYQQALTDGANFVVGPLQKQNIETLVHSEALPVPTLSLNSNFSTNNKLYHNLFTFGLSPIDEAQQTATHAIETHHQRVIVIAKDDAWSKSLVETFTKQWTQMGGTIVDTQWYNHQKKLATDIQNILNIRQAFQNKNALQTILQEPVRYLPRRRKDFDSIFLVASPQSAKQIIPLLRFYFANDIPIFATSQIYRNTASASYNRDLNGVFFCDLPWIINQKTLQPERLDGMRKHINTLWPKHAKKYARFYALGIDAFDLVHKLNKMIMLPELSTLGATGTLTLTQSHHLYRELPWAFIHKGHAELANT